jgi:hypothetical protein
MSSAGILEVCIAAFILIFILLSLLSIMMRGLTYLFPVIEREDEATIAAITTAYRTIYPDRKVTRVKETTK